mmetsp:Transcript_12626/g.27984  ORF Transcript_12626/g.27984 Transcript_12626/m.27984 type:complete len:655 (-) Transcript_12626:640-2604(-)
MRRSRGLRCSSERRISMQVGPATAVLLSLLLTSTNNCPSVSGFIVPDSGMASPLGSSALCFRRSLQIRSVTAPTAPRQKCLAASIVPAENKEGDRISKRARFMKMLGIKKLSKNDDGPSAHDASAEAGADAAAGTVTDIPVVEKIEIKTIPGLYDYWADKKKRFRKKKGKKDDGTTSVGAIDDDGDDIDYDALLAAVDVKGDTQIIGSPDHPDLVHPVLQLLHERRRTKSPLTPTTETRPDGFKVALVVEGGGMRGCLSAGMVAAIHYLGLEDTFDVVYGSSAGTVIGAYFITRQLPWFGPEIYYDSLTTAGKQFIDTKRLLRSVGVGLVDPRLLKDVVVRRANGKPVLNLPFLLKSTAQEKKPLDWEKFVEMQKVQPLKIVSSGLKRGRSVVLDMEKGNFENRQELADCMHSSCLLPGIAGPLMNLDTRENGGGKLKLGNRIDEPHLEPLADALIFEPLPYKTAIENGATHVVLLRTRPDGTDVAGKSSIFERLIVRRFFLRKNKLPNVYKYMRKHLHKRIYSEQVIALNDAAHDFRDYTDDSSPHMMPIAVAPGSPEVTKLETGREAIFDGVRRGFARAYDALVEDPKERGRGMIVAKECFPDEILDYDPLDIDSKIDSAFDCYLKQSEGNIISSKKASKLGKTAEEAGAPR